MEQRYRGAGCACRSRSTTASGDRPDDLGYAAMRVLIAEDSNVLRRALRRAVEGLGHVVLEAADGGTAWSTFEREGADVVISDWTMPGIEGPELCRRVRAAPERPYTYFVILTVLEEKKHALAGMRAGADDYLTKPVDLDDVQLRLIAAE